MYFMRTLPLVREANIPPKQRIAKNVKLDFTVVKNTP
jgi:hypothetical protein